MPLPAKHKADYDLLQMSQAPKQHINYNSSCLFCSPGQNYWHPWYICAKRAVKIKMHCLSFWSSIQKIHKNLIFQKIFKFHNEISTHFQLIHITTVPSTWVGHQRASLLIKAGFWSGLVGEKHEIYDFTNPYSSFICTVTYLYVLSFILNCSYCTTSHSFII